MQQTNDAELKSGPEGLIVLRPTIVSSALKRSEYEDNFLGIRKSMGGLVGWGGLTWGPGLQWKAIWVA